MLIDWNTVII